MSMIHCGLLKRPLALALIVTLLLTLFCAPAAIAEDTGVTNARVVLRKSADKDSKALQTLPEGEEVSVLSVSGDWYKINYGYYTGYVMKKYITVSKTSVTANASKIADLGDAPGALHIGDEGNDVKKLQKALKILGYYKNTVDGKYGDGTTAAVTAYQKAQGLEDDGIAGKSTIKSIFGSCAKKTDITVSGEDTSSKSSTSSGSSSSSSTSKTSTANTVSSIEEIGSAPAATKEGDSGKNVTKLQQALELLGYYTGDIDGNYGEKTTAAVKRLQKNRGMNQDGIAGAATIRVLFGSSAASSTSSSSSSSTTIKTETPDWFADNVSKLIPKNAKVVIKDVRTGKTFNAVRWSGSNHMDTEPATSEDTAILKSIYGGSWSWSRRPILVKYNGHVYAASMNGMPHGTTTISNGFDGHFCVHFKNSKTHGTKKVDADHQAAVTVASKATW